MYVNHLVLDFLNDKSLKLHHVVIIGIVSSFSDKDKPCYISNSKFAEYLHMKSIPHVSEYINHLINNHYLSSNICKENGNFRNLFLTKKSKNIIKRAITKNENTITENGNTLLPNKVIPITENGNTLLPKKGTNNNNDIEKEKENVYMGSTSEQAPSPNIYIDVLSSSDFDKYRVPNEKDDFGDDVFEYTELVKNFVIENMDKNIVIPEAKISRLLCWGLIERVGKKLNKDSEDVRSIRNDFNSYHLSKNTFKDNMKVKTLLNIVQGYMKNKNFCKD